MATITVLDATGQLVAIEKPLPPGRQSADGSRPVALSAEDKAVLDAIGSRLVVATEQLDDLLAGTREASLLPLGMAAVTITTSAQTITQRLVAASALGGAVPLNARVVAIQPRGGDIRLTDDGQNPTNGSTGLGLDVFDGAYFLYTGSLGALRFIAAASTPCTLSFYG